MKDDLVSYRMRMKGCTIKVKECEGNKGGKEGRIVI